MFTKRMVDGAITKVALTDDARLWFTQDELPQWSRLVRLGPELVVQEGAVVVAVLGEGHDSRVVHLVPACLLVCEQ